MPLMYTSLSEFEQEVPVNIMALATDDTLSPGTSPSSHIVEAKLLSAESLVNGYLQQRYAIPIKAPDGRVPEIVKQAVHTIAKYQLYARRNNVGPDVAEQYNNVISWLKDVARGVASIAVFDDAGELDQSYVLEIITGEEDPQLFRRGWQ